MGLLHQHGEARTFQQPQKIRQLKALVWSVTIYGCEGWTVYSKEQKYIDAFECGVIEGS